MNDEKKGWLDRAGTVHLWKTIEAILGTKVDKIEGFGLSSNDYTTEETKQNRLDYIASVLIIQAMWQQQIK